MGAAGNFAAGGGADGSLIVGAGGLTAPLGATTGVAGLATSAGLAAGAPIEIFAVSALAALGG